MLFLLQGMLTGSHHNLGPRHRANAALMLAAACCRYHIGVT
jgi:hypothetical protein